MIVKENQSVFDITAQKLGTIEAAFDLCLANDICITDDLFSNQVVEIPNSDKKETDVLNYFAEKKINPASGFPLVLPEPIGIGVMIIEQNFYVY